MTSKNFAEVMERARTWPEEDQERLADLARVIESERTGVYVVSADERAAIEEGLAQAKRGEFASDEEVAAMWKRFGEE